ncbi:MAG: hypothetical protein LC541_12260 [Candidatus Thiodiazotropha sp.]|nr:hypothetical protein [Candidatus Thiodiazotropha sp.]MCM8884045.1 hypothetical protein [Candidatus Thiodiazotropha sp.]MCM8919706.1 hypothetical protein [Candidatus Thiodiazotropha sp.]
MMLLNPAIMALLLVSIVVCSMLMLASGFAIQVLRHWDIESGSERQLGLERRTYLISTLLIWAFSFELMSLLLFIYNAESMSGQFVGAMCATGVLNVNGWGWPTLFLKIAVFFSGAVWLALNYLDNQGYDYPVVKYKYRLLLAILPLVVAEFILQLLYFTNMDPDVITSCCGTLFSSQAEGVAAEVSGLPPRNMMLVFILIGVIVIVSGLRVALRVRGNWFFALLGGAAFVVALMSIVSFVSLYIYEHPHHHCPFCILKSGHDYVGYILYVPLFIAAALAMSVGALSSWRDKPSLTLTVNRVIPRLSWIAVIFFALFYLAAGWSIWASNLTMAEVW